MNTQLSEALTKASQTAQLLMADVLDAYHATIKHESPAEKIACSYLLQLIGEARSIQKKLEAIA